MTGSLRSSKGRFYAVLNLKDDYGNRKQKSINLHLDDVPGNKKKAESALRKVLREYEENRVEVLVEDRLFCDYILEWLEDSKSRLEIGSYDSYKMYIDKHIFPHFQKLNVTVQNLRHTHIESYYREKIKILSANTLKKHHAVINQTLNRALKHDVIHINPATKVDLPSSKKYNANFLTVEQGKALLSAAKGTDMETAVLLGMVCGLRRSEIAGLKWDAIDFDNNTLTIRHTVTRTLETAKDRTKNKSSNRTLPLSIDVRNHLIELQEKQKMHKELCGSSYHKTDYINRWADGKPKAATYYSRGMKRILADNDLPQIRLHDLRHSCASYMLKMGCNLKEISHWLGHSNISTTMDVYGHLDTDSVKAIAMKFEILLDSRLDEEATASQNRNTAHKATKSSAQKAKSPQNCMNKGLFDGAAKRTRTSTSFETRS